MKIFLSQQNYHTGNFDKNTEKIIKAIESAKQKKADLIVFSEMSICGHPAKDYLFNDDFIERCCATLDIIRQHADDIAVIVGGPEKNPDKIIKRLFNSAFFLHEKEVKYTIRKTCLSNRGVYDESRYFDPATAWELISFKGKKMAITIGNDLHDPETGANYAVNPVTALLEQQPDLLINISASAFDYTHIDDRKAFLQASALTYKLPLIYCNAAGSQTEIIFDGNSSVYDDQGNLVLSLPTFEEASGEINLFQNGSFSAQSDGFLGPVRLKTAGPEGFDASKNIDLVYDALIVGIRDYFKKSGFRKAILGSSGGLDSAVTLAIACAALGRENVTAVLMPSVYSTSHSVSDAVNLSENLRNPYHTIAIGKLYDQFVDDLKPVFGDLPFDVTEENIQARTRGVLVMALANKYGSILLNTSNKSELSVGYGTLYGDLAGGLSVLGDCYKSQVYALAHFINRNGEVIPQHIITKMPSAELRPDQKDSDSLPLYEVLDPLLYAYIDLGHSNSQLKLSGFDAGLVDRVLTMINRNEYKRGQFCPILQISAKGFGSGRRFPVAGYF